MFECFSDTDEGQTQHTDLDITLYDIYIERMCVFNSADVEAYLKTNNKYRSESAYQVNVVGQSS